MTITNEVYRKSFKSQFILKFKEKTVTLQKVESKKKKKRSIIYPCMQSQFSLIFRHHTHTVKLTIDMNLY